MLILLLQFSYSVNSTNDDFLMNVPKFLRPKCQKDQERDAFGFPSDNWWLARALNQDL